MKPLKILLLGHTGQVGWELHRSLYTLGDLTALDYPQIDLADPVSIRAALDKVKPDLIVNAAAYTDVDKAENERDLAMAVNGLAPGILAEEARNRGAALIHYSTDYVFDGEKGSPYTEEDQPNPLNWYGQTKLAGERAVQAADISYLIFRTSWVYSLRRPCFVTKVLAWARTHEVLRIVDDQVSTPTWARTLAQATAQVVAQGRGDPLGWLAEKRGLYHLTDGGSCSRYEWAREIIRLAGFGDRVVTQPASSLEFPISTTRPKYSVLTCDSLSSYFGMRNQGWSNLILTIELL